MSIENRKIVFEKGKILNVDMLKELQESTKEYFKIKYYSYCDGIIEGFNFRYNNSENLTLTPGVLKYDGELYISRNEIVIKSKEEFKLERKERNLFFSLLPQILKTESNIEIKELLIEITEEPLENGVFIGSFVDRVNNPPKTEYEKLQHLNDKVYINTLNRVYANADGEAVTPWIGKLLLEEFIKKTTLSPIEMYLFNRGIENKPILNFFISQYLGDVNIEKFNSEEILSKIIQKIENSVCLTQDIKPNPRRNISSIKLEDLDL
ncbi:MAG: hypothetical protein ACRCZR_00855 [Cetobacterium sp.]